MKRFKSNSEIYVIGILVFVFILSEIILRTFEDNLSGNIRHINSIESILNDMNESNSKNILFMGNSLIGDGIDPLYFQSELAKKGMMDVGVHKIVPDGTNLLDWYYILKNNLFPKKIVPDLIFIGYAWNQLEDNHAIDHIRLGAHFCNLKDFPELTELGLDNFGAQSEFIFAHASSIFAHRSTIRNRILDILIPSYRAETRRINDFGNLQQNFPQQPLSKKSYLRLRKFVNLLHELYTRVIFIAMPILEEYDVDPEIAGLLKNENMYFLDCRFIPDLDRKYFVDHMHLGAEGQKILCSYLVNNTYSEHSEIAEHLTMLTLDNPTN